MLKYLSSEFLFLSEKHNGLSNSFKSHTKLSENRYKSQKRQPPLYAL